MSAAPSQSTPLTEKAALADLVTWVEKRPAWQREEAPQRADAEAMAALGELSLKLFQRDVAGYPCGVGRLALIAVFEIAA